MKRVRGVFIFLVGLILLSLNPIKVNAADNGYYIKNMKVDVEVNDKRQYIVTETIEVFFNEPRHGIVRSIPKKSTLEEYNIEDILCSESSRLINSADKVDIKIGNSKESATGDKEYVIKYMLSHYEDGESDGDYIYLNVLGNQWDTRIENFEANVIYPDGAEVESINITDGINGSKNSTLVNYIKTKNGVNIKSTQSIYPNNAVTLMVKLREGTFLNAPKKSIFIRIKQYIPLLIAIIVLSIISILYFKFNDKKRAYKAIEFYPPEEISSADAAYIYNGDLMSKDIIGLLFYWAGHNHLKIRKDEGGIITLIRVSELDETHSEYEKSLFSEMFQYGNGNEVRNIELKDKFYMNINVTEERLKKNFSDNNEIFSRKSKLIRIVGYIISVLPIMAMDVLFLSQGRNGILNWLQTLVILVPCLPIVGFLRAFKSFGARVADKGIRCFMFILFIAIYSFVSITLTKYINIPLYIRILVFYSTFIGILLTSLIKVRTDYGLEIYEGLLGFREFLLVAEKSRLEALLDENPEYFYNTLPYAQALGITDKWVEKFIDIGMDAPSFYESSYNYSIYGFLYDMNSLLSVGQSPSSSSGGGGFSDGGSSGGGSGGGGGSSW